MALAPGTELGPYRITGLLGAGGMGEVYRATDTKLQRDVAIKVLPDAFARDEQRMKRLEREAQVLASLNHPHIAAIYGLEGQALVLELVEGPTLADQIREGPIPVEEVLRLARQMAEALAEAHEKGIVHRDLKPANVKLTEDGQIKILDFGLARVVEAEASSMSDGASRSPTLSRQATVAGMILGTAAYMSPEQAKGKIADRRADVWAFGVVLYEMLTGKRAFDGDDVSEILAAVLRAEPDFDALPSETPASIRRLLRRALEKNRKERLSDIGDARLEIEDALEGPDEVQTPRAVRTPWLLAVAGLVLGALAMWTLGRFETPSSPGVTRYAIVPPSGDLLESGLAWSPDGKLLVYSASRDGVPQLFLRARDQLEPVPIRGTEGGVYPFFSPDGQWIGFFVEGSLKKLPVGGGPSQTLCAAGFRMGASWGRDDTIVFASNAEPGLMRVPAAGGTPEALTGPSGEGRHNWPEVLPGGKAILFTISQQGPVSDKKVAVLELERGETLILVDGTHPRYARSGQLVFAREDSLWAVAFDVDRLELTGSPAPVVEDVQVNRGGGLALFDLSPDGSLAYFSGTGSRLVLALADREGNVTWLVPEEREFAEPRFSPDGTRIAVELDDEIWMFETSRGALSRFTTGGGRDPLWTPDGARLTYVGLDNAIYWKPADGSGEAELLAPPGQAIPRLGTWSPDGEVLMLGSRGQLVTLRKGASVEPFRTTPFQEQGPELSPDGRWLLTQSYESGRWDVYLEPYPGPGERILVSLAGGTQPSWSRDGREIFYRSEGHLMSVPFDSGKTPPVDPPRKVLERSGTVSSFAVTSRHYDPAPDGGSFALVTEPVALGTQEIRVVLNWLEELAPAR